MKKISYSVEELIRDFISPDMLCNVHSLHIKITSDKWSFERRTYFHWTTLPQRRCDVRHRYKNNGQMKLIPVFEQLYNTIVWDWFMKSRYSQKLPRFINRVALPRQDVRNTPSWWFYYYADPRFSSNVSILVFWST